MLGIGINYFDRRISKFLSCSFSFFVLSFFLSFFLSSFLPSFPWKDGSPTVGRTRCYSGTPPCEGVSPVLGTASPPGTVCAWGKAALPRTGCPKTTKGQASSPLSGWPQVPSGVPGVSFHFSERTSPVPPQSTSGFPLREKTPRPMGL